MHSLWGVTVTSLPLLKVLHNKDAAFAHESLGAIEIDVLNNALHNTA